MTRKRTRLITLTLSFVLALFTFQAATEDIDIFSVDEDNNVDKPNVLIVLDNSANWSRQSQQWPGGLTQGQSEVRAIKKVIGGLEEGSLNLGLLEFSTQGSSSDQDAGYVRYHIRPMTGSVTDPNSNRGMLAAKLDTIFGAINDPIEKRPQGNPFGTIMWDVFNYLGGLKQAKLGAGTPNLADPSGYASKYDTFRSPLTSVDGCRRTIVIFIGNNTQSGPSKDDVPAPRAIEALKSAGGSTAQLPMADFAVKTEQVSVSLGNSSCYASSAACTTAVSAAANCADQGFTSCSCGTTGTACPLSKFTVVGRGTKQEIVKGPTTESSVEATGEVTQCQNNSPGSYTCPATSTTYTPGPGADETTQTTVSWAGCSYVKKENACGSNNNKDLWTPTGTKTTTETVRRTTVTDTVLGPSSSCAVDTGGCSTSAYADCSPPDGTPFTSCFCTTPSDSTGCGSSGTSRFPVTATLTRSEATLAGTFSQPTGGPWVADEWAQYLRNVGVPLPGSGVTYDGNGYPVVPQNAPRAPVTTYTLDVFNAQQSAEFSGLLFNMARVGGGKYFQAKNEDQIVAALEQIFAEVQAVNTAFASASLPVSATNRAQNENQVFIGLFRPDRVKRPLWFGNLKRYEVIKSGPELLLGDVNKKPAINNLTGFISECATSFWTTDSGEYWLKVGTDDPPAVGLCTSSGTSPNSDMPDGPFVEKGAVAEVLRKGNTQGTADANGNYPVVRNLRTRTSTGNSAFVDFEANATGVDADTIKFIVGKDIADDDNDTNLTEPRSTIHGDVVHSRPQPVNYGEGKVVVYYGANDGTFRAVNAKDGRELWAFVAPEHFGKLDRLRKNTPIIRYADSTSGDPKDYFFDGSTGLLQNRDNSRVWIFTSMRRGGRKVYAFDVSNPDSPLFKWAKGCNADGTCDPGFDEMGQSWSQPNPAFISNFDNGTDGAGKSPVVIYGGGYDTCEDADSATLSCDNSKGSGVYAVNAANGALIKHFDFTRSVVADVALIDVDFDGKVDFGYAVDTGGSVHRINFTTSPWSAELIASTEGDGRKFLFAPALLQTKNANGQPVVYVAVGSGDREHPLRTDYPFLDPITNRFYVFKDEPTGSLPQLDLDDENFMLDQTTPLLNEVSQDCAEKQILPDSAERGWFFDLTDYGRGEQTVTSAVIAGGNVFFSTNRAELPPTDSLACTTALGEARGYAVNLLTSAGVLGDEGACGARSDEFVGGGLPPSPVIATVPIEGGGTETICIGCGGRDSPLDTREVGTDIPSIRQMIYWYTESDTE